MSEKAADVALMERCIDEAKGIENAKLGDNQAFCVIEIARELFRSRVRNMPEGASWLDVFQSEVLEQLQKKMQALAQKCAELETENQGLKTQVVQAVQKLGLLGKEGANGS